MTFFWRSVVLLMCITSVAQGKTLLDRIAIIVNDAGLLQSEIADRRETLIKQIKLQGARIPPDDVLMNQLLERMILESIQNQMADQMQIKVTDQQVNQAIERIASQQGLDYKGYLNQLGTAGISSAEIRAQLAVELRHYQLQQRMLAPRIEVSDQEVQQFLASAQARENQRSEYRLSHILLQLEETASPKQVEQVLAQANKIIEQLREQPSRFAEFAIAKSADSFALKGGDMGWRTLNQIPRRFVDPLLKLKPNQLSKPIRSPSGFHVIMLADQRGGQQVLVEQAKIDHILIKPNQIRSEEQARQLASEIRDNLLDGGSMSELARTFSDDPGSALNGGSLGWTNLDELDQQFAKVASSIELGKFSQVFQSQFGYHVVRVNERRTEDVSQVVQKSKAQRLLQQREFEELLPIWLNEIRSQAYIDFKGPFKQFDDKTDDKTAKP